MMMLLKQGQLTLLPSRLSGVTVGDLSVSFYETEK